ncbi:MAG: hypothetical protein JWO62_571, partial [Acidimicrobiaceae bacterium]|nr:hypothetical protein [Acidimicrobiaceae bacterium]
MIAFEMVSRELTMLALVAAIGTWPVALLGERFDRVSRIALAPIFGICVATSLTTTLLWFTPASNTSWTLPLLAVSSLVGAYRRFAGSHRLARRPTGIGDPESEASPGGRPASVFVFAMQLFVVVLAVAGPITYTFVARNSVGPVGYRVGDAQGYVASIDAAQRQSLRTEVRLIGTRGYGTNLEQQYASDYAAGYQELDATPLAANVDALMGLWATDTQGPFLVVYLLAGATALFAAIRYATGRMYWSAVIGAALYGGAFFLQLFYDGSEGALLGLALIIPLAVLGFETIREPRRRNLGLLALLGSGMIAFYPLFLPAVGLVAIGATSMFAIRALTEHRLTRNAIVRFALSSGAVLLLVIALNLVDT